MDIGKSTRLGNAVEFGQSLFFYDIPPTETLSLQTFEEYAADRLKILKTVEKIGIKFVKGSNDYQEALRNELRKVQKEISLKILFQISKDSLEESRSHDNTSHFILRLAYCKTEDLRRWFINQETDLFRFRFLCLDISRAKEFLKCNNLVYEPISEDEKNSLKDQFISGTVGINADSFEITTFYKVHFTEVLELVKSQRVYIKGGFAYVPQNELVVCITNLFRTRLSKEVAITGRSLFRIGNETRVMPVLTNLSQNCAMQEPLGKHVTGTVTANMVEGLSKASFPLCMQELHRALRETHHLKHQGRLQYGLFLKGIGLTLEEAMKFFKQEFVRVMTEEKFMKEYAYNIRYNYGKEGKRVNYTPYNCLKIITTNQPSAGDRHGCPFKHYDSEVLRQRLRNVSLPAEGIDEIVNLSKQGQYQIACGRCFELKHNIPDRFIPSHPNLYFNESQKVLKNGVPQAVASSSEVNLVPVPKVKGGNLSQSENTWDDDGNNDDFSMAVD